MALPLLISVPHAGLEVPPEVEPLNLLSPRQIAEDGDEGAAGIYSFADDVAAFATADVARAFVDLNRAENDARADGVVKTHTCWRVPIYRQPLPAEVVEALLVRYHRPYHARLTGLAGAGVVLGVDCHTMAAKGPPLSPDPGARRPRVCLSNGDGTCPQEWMTSLARAFEDAFDRPVSINSPFNGGHIVRSHAAELPWVQLELSREPFLTDEEKRRRTLDALRAWSRGV